MQLFIKNYLIDTPIETILLKLRQDTGNYYLKDMSYYKEDDIKITCPFHKFGQENHPSCFVYARQDNPQVEYGFYKCFTCGEQGPLYKLVAHCIDPNNDEEVGKKWLIDNFGTVLYDMPVQLEDEISFKKPAVKKLVDENELERYNKIHPYMFKRGLTEPIIKMFKIGYNEEKECITFPCWDEHNDLVMITERNVNNKKFFIPPGVDKPVYLLNFVQNMGYKEAWICESQLDALKAWTWGYPAVALFGTGSKQQYEILNKSEINTFHLCFDGDLAGDKAIVRFKKNISPTKLVDVVKIPIGKDVNDLTFEEFSSLYVV